MQGAEVNTKALARSSQNEQVQVQFVRALDQTPIPSQEISISDLLAILRRRAGIIATCVGVAVVLAAAYSLLATKKYEARARIAVNSQNSDALGLEDLNLPIGGDATTKLETQVRILQSESLAWEVIGNLRLDQREDFAGKELVSQPGQSLNQINDIRKAKLIKNFAQSAKIQSIPKTQIIELRFRSSNPHLAGDVANKLANAYLERNFRTRFEATMQASEWLSKQLGDLKLKAQDAQERLVRYQKESGIIGVDENNNIVIAKLDELNRKLTEAQAERIVREANYREAAKGSPELLARTDPSSVLNVLRSQQAVLNSEYAQLTAKYGSGYPRVIQLKSQIDQVQAAITFEVTKLGQKLQSEYMAASRSEAMLRDALDQQKQDAYKMSEGSIQYAMLKREVESSRDLYEGLVKKLKEAGVVSGLKSTNVDIVDPAGVPVEPVEPRTPLNLTLALLGGLVVGVGMAFIKENMDHTIHTPEDVEAVCQLPSLAVVPSASKRNKGPLPEGEQLMLPLSVWRPRSSFAESFRLLRASILLSHAGQPPKVLLITSSSPQEGKTTVSINSAVALAQKGRRVLLIDADLRLPRLHERLGLEMTAGLTGCLAGASTLDAAVVPLNTMHFDVLPAGMLPPNPADLLGSEQMKALLDECRQLYDHIIIDSPPTLVVSDPVLLSVVVDSVVLVARCGQTSRHALRRASTLLRSVDAHLAGIVVNDFDAKRDMQYGYSEYGNYYEESLSNKEKEEVLQ
jgi:polysaccharide biosynthesis transport protein